MMNEVTKLYENANVKAKEYCDRDSDACMNCCPEWKNRQNCWKYKSVMPLFTAEKQIAILKLLTQQCDLTISHFTKWEFIHFDGQEPLQITGKDFTETLAKLVNAYWQNLTEEEKQQVKDILE